MTRNNEITVTVVRSAMVCSFEPNYDCIIIIIIYSLRIGAGQQGRISGTYSCPPTHPFNCPSSGTTRAGRYQKGETNLDFTEARDSEWQWHQMGHASLHLAPDR